MLQYEELKLALEALKTDMDDLAAALNLERCRRELSELETKAAAAVFGRHGAAQSVLQKISAGRPYQI